MEITPNVIVNFISTYLLAGTVCFVGCFIREVYAANKSHTKINITKLFIQTIVSALFGCIIIRILRIKEIDIPIEFFTGIMFLLGFWADSFMDLLYNKTTIIKFLQNLLDHLGTAGKLFAEAWRAADKENDDRKEKNNNSEHINDNKTEKE